MTLTTLQHLGQAFDAGWQDIGSAPKDGRAVLTYMPPLAHQDRGHINIQRFMGEKIGWKFVGMPKRRVDYPPTHWMPLPPPPVANPEITPFTAAEMRRRRKVFGESDVYLARAFKVSVGAVRGLLGEQG